MVKWLNTIKRVEETTFTVEKMMLDDKGHPQPTGEFETIEADTLILALGQDVDRSLLDKVPGLTFDKGVVNVGRNMMTGYPGIFAGGDMVPSERTVTVAIGHGKKAARNIGAWLCGGLHEPGPKNEIARHDQLHTRYGSDAPKSVQRDRWKSRTARARIFLFG